MRKVRVAAYKASKGGWTDWAIALWTAPWNLGVSFYSHVEVGFQIQENGTWRYFSSSIRDKGTRWKWATEIFKHPENWDIYEMEYPEENVSRMIELAHTMVGKPYDILGIFGFVTVTGQIANKKEYWYCSEIVFFIMTCGFWTKRISPMSLVKRILKAGAKKINLT
jgi:hypothetical protein